MVVCSLGVEEDGLESGYGMSLFVRQMAITERLTTWAGKRSWGRVTWFSWITVGVAGSLKKKHERGGDGENHRKNIGKEKHRLSSYLSSKTEKQAYETPGPDSGTVIRCRIFPFVDFRSN